MVLKNFKIYFFIWYFVISAVVIGDGIFPFTQAQRLMFLTLRLLCIFTFTSLVIVIELCTLVRYEVIVLKYR